MVLALNDRAVSTLCSVDSYLDRVLPAAVNQMNGRAGRFSTGAKLLDSGDDVLLDVGAQVLFQQTKNGAPQ
jgi:hypothetical protein